MSKDLYTQLVQILEAYLGPTADRFVRRHVESHLDKPTEQISKSDIPELATWIKLSLSVLSDDTKLVAACERKILALSRSSPASKRHAKLTA